MINEIEADSKKWKDIPCSWSGRINIAKIAILPKAIYRFNAIPNVPRTFFTELEQMILNFVWNHKRPLIARESWGKKNKPGGRTLPDFQLYHKATVGKTACYWHKERQRSMEQNRESKNKPTHMWSINLQQRRQEYMMEKRQSLNKLYWANLTGTCKTRRSEHSLIPY